MMYTSRHQLIKSELIMALTRPPKPPCWRDFVSVADIKKKKHDRTKLDPLEFTDLGQVLQAGPDHSEPTYATKKVHVISHRPKPDKSRSPVPKEKPAKCEKEGHKPRKEKERTLEAKTTKRSKHRLHRTRSSAALRPENLGEMTVTLAEADPNSRELGLNPGKYTGYKDENHRRCMKWLQSVQASQPLDDVAFLGGSGEEVEIPEETSSQLQSVQVQDQTHRETTGDFLDSDALKLSPIEEITAEKKHVKSKSKAHRKAKQYQQRKKITKEVRNRNARSATDIDNFTQDEIARTTIGAENLAKATQTVQDDIVEISSSKSSDKNAVNEAASGAQNVSGSPKAGPEDSPTDVNYNTQDESVQETTLSFQEETEQWQTLCEKLQTYTLDINDQQLKG